MNKQLLTAVALAALSIGAVVATETQQYYAGLDEQPLQQYAAPLNYDAPAVPAGQAAPGEIRHSVTGHVRNLAGVVGKNGKRMLQDAQPVLLGIKDDLAKTKDRIAMNPNVVKVRNSLPTRESVKQTTAPYLAKGQEKIGNLMTNIKNRRQNHAARRQERLNQQQQQLIQEQQQQQMIQEQQMQQQQFQASQQ